MLFRISQYKIKYLPLFKGKLFRLLMSNKNLKVGANFKCDNWPSVWITDNGKINIGDNVHFRKNVELRCHQNAMIEIKGDNRIDIGVRILATNKSIIEIGKKTRIGLHSVLNGGDSISLGNNVLISGFVYLQTSNHNFSKNREIMNQGYSHGPIKIENDCWIAAHVVVLPNITIEKGAVIGSNAVVTKNIKSDTINGGIPAKFLKSRYE